MTWQAFHLNGPTGLIFAMRSRYSAQDGTEAFFNEADTAFSGQDAGAMRSRFPGASVGMGTTSQSGSNSFPPQPATADETAYKSVRYGTGDAENLGGTGR